MSEQNQPESMVELSINDGVAEVVLNAPQKLNSLDEKALADLSKAYDETVYQINCEKSAWLIVIKEYVSPNGKSEFSELRVLTEEDVFKYYDKK